MVFWKVTDRASSSELSIVQIGLEMTELYESQNRESRPDCEPSGGRFARVTADLFMGPNIHNVNKGGSVHCGGKSTVSVWHTWHPPYSREETRILKACLQFTIYNLQFSIHFCS